MFRSDLEEKYIEEIKNTKWFKSGNISLLRATSILSKNRINAAKIHVGDLYREKSLDTNAKYHTITNNLSQEKLGVNIRNGLFCSFDYDVVEDYAINSKSGYYDIVHVIPSDNAILYVNPHISDFYVETELASDRKFNELSIEEKELYKTPEILLIDKILPEYVDGIIKISHSSVSRFYSSDNEIIVFGDVYFISISCAREHFPNLNYNI
jgi:hypothetical protein